MRCIPASVRSGTVATAMAWLLAAAGLTVASVASAGGESTEEGAAKAADGLRVRITLDVSGELLAPVGPDAPPIREPVEMTARFDFEETAAEPSAAGSAAARSAVACRSYHDATASMRVGGTATTATLAADARRILVARQGTTAIPYLADGFLSGEEYDLLETPFDPLLLDDMLPKTPVSIGQMWEVPADVTAGLLAIDTVESGVIEARLQEVGDAGARVAFTGIIDGAADGVPTHVTVEGSFFVAVKSDAAKESGSDPDVSTHEFHGRVLQVSALIRERRQASHVAPGFEVEAKLAVARSPLGGAASGGTPAEAAAAVVEQAASTSAADGRPSRRLEDGGPGRIWYADTKGRFDLVHDARWRRVEDGANGLVMRLVDRGALVGQCSITSLPQAAAASLPTRVEVQRDIERSLAGQVVRSDAAEESDRGDGVRVVRIASSGTAGRLPFRWIHYVVAAQDGSRVSVTFMCEESMWQRFADADQPLIEGLRLTRSQPGRESDAEPAATAAVPQGGGQPTR